MTAPLEGRRARWCFSTLGCADLSFPDICGLAGEFRIQGIELRGIGGRMDMPQYCADENLMPAVMRETAQRHQAKLAVAGSSLKLVDATDTHRVELLAF